MNAQTDPGLAAPAAAGFCPSQQRLEVIVLQWPSPARRATQPRRPTAQPDTARVVRTTLCPLDDRAHGTRRYVLDLVHARQAGRRARSSHAYTIYAVTTTTAPVRARRPGGRGYGVVAGAARVRARLAACAHAGGRSHREHGRLPRTLR